MTQNKINNRNININKMLFQNNKWNSLYSFIHFFLFLSLSLFSSRIIFINIILTQFIIIYLFSFNTNILYVIRKWRSCIKEELDNLTHIRLLFISHFFFNLILLVFFILLFISKLVLMRKKITERMSPLTISQTDWWPS